MTKHLSTQGKPDSTGGLYCFWCPNKTWNPSIGASGTFKSSKYWKFYLRESTTQKKKNKPPNVVKANSQTAKNNFVCYSVGIRVQKTICKTSSDTPITSHSLKWIKNKKVMRFENKKGQNENFKIKGIL